MNPRRARGVTLVEVLVVLAILAILGVLVLNTARRSVTEAKGTATMANLRQIYTALKLYESDYGAYPPNSVLFPGFRPYLGGDPPMPPLAPPVEQWGPGESWNYRLTAFTSHPVFRAHAACKQKRGSSFILAFDPTFPAQRFAVQTRRMLFYYVREDGSVAKYDATSLNLRMLRNPDQFPCPGLAEIFNLP